VPGHFIIPNKNVGAMQASERLTPWLFNL